MKCLTKKGFTLVELMVVIAIIGLLAAALITQSGNFMSTARSTKCKANLRSLAQAAQNYGVQDDHRYPTAGSFEYIPFEMGTTDIIYRGRRGWVSWTQGNGSGWPWGPKNESRNTSHRDKMSRETYYGEKTYISITNGALWRLVGKDASIYRCDEHKSAAPKQKVYRSYVMNGYFNYDKGGVQHTNDGRVRVEDAVSDGKAAVRLMFAELPALEARKTEEFEDSVLEYDMNGNSNRKSESIGFNHLIAKRWVGHVAFLDGHVEGIILPNKAKTTDAKGRQIPNYGHSDLKDLTGQLCDAQEIKSSIRETMH